MHDRRKGKGHVTIEEFRDALGELLGKKDLRRHRLVVAPRHRPRCCLRRNWISADCPM
jgi:hypothetical protein